MNHTKIIGNNLQSNISFSKHALSSVTHQTLQAFSECMVTKETTTVSKPLKLAATTIIEFTEGVGHIALHINTDNLTEDFLYDPAGSYMPDSGARGTSDFFSGDDTDINQYLKYWKEQGEEPTLYKLETTAKQEEAITDRAIEQGGAAPFFCADSASAALGGVCGIEGSFFPHELARQAKQAVCE